MVRYWIDKYGVAMAIDKMGDRHIYYTVRMLRRQAAKNFEERIDRLNRMNSIREMQRINIARAAGCKDIKDVKPDDFAPMVLTYLLEEAEKRGIDSKSDKIPESNLPIREGEEKVEEILYDIPTRILELP